MNSFAAESVDMQQMSNKLLCVIVTRLRLFTGAVVVIAIAIYHHVMIKCNKVHTPLSPETAFGIQ